MTIHSVIFRQKMSKAILAEHIENKFVIISPDMVKEGGCGNKEMIISQALAPPHTHTQLTNCISYL